MDRGPAWGGHSKGPKEHCSRWGPHPLMEKLLWPLLILNSSMLQGSPSSAVVHKLSLKLRMSDMPAAVAAFNSGQHTHTYMHRVHAQPVARGTQRAKGIAIIASMSRRRWSQMCRTAALIDRSTLRNKTARNQHKTANSCNNVRAVQQPQLEYNLEPCRQSVRCNITYKLTFRPCQIKTNWQSNLAKAASNHLPLTVRDGDPYLIQRLLGSCQPPPQTGCRSVQLFLHGPPVSQTDTHAIGSAHSLRIRSFQCGPSSSSQLNLNHVT